MAGTRLKKRKAGGKRHESYTIGERIELECKTGCGNVEVVTPNISAVTCADCCQKLLAPPPSTVKPLPESERRPRGWQFKARYVGPDGTVYEKGKVVTDVKKKRKGSK